MSNFVVLFSLNTIYFLCDKNAPGNLFVVALSNLNSWKSLFTKFLIGRCFEISFLILCCILLYCVVLHCVGFCMQKTVLHFSQKM